MTVDESELNGKQVRIKTGEYRNQIGTVEYYIRTGNRYAIRLKESGQLHYYQTNEIEEITDK